MASPPPPLRLPEEGLSQPLSACTDGSYTDRQVVQYTADREERGWESLQYIPTRSRRGERLGGQMFGRRRGGAVRSLTNIYSFGLANEKKTKQLRRHLYFPP